MGLSAWGHKESDTTERLTHLSFRDGILNMDEINALFALKYSIKVDV